MSDEKATTPTWVYNTSGDSQLVDLPAGAQAPKGWAFAPPAGVEIKVEDAEQSAPAPLSSPMPIDDPRVAALEDRIKVLETQMQEIGEFLEAMSAPAGQADDKATLLARAKELGLEGFDGRSKIDKIKAAIVEAEAKALEA